MIENLSAITGPELLTVWKYDCSVTSLEAGIQPTFFWSAGGNEIMSNNTNYLIEVDTQIVNGAVNSFLTINVALGEDTNYTCAADFGSWGSVEAVVMYDFCGNLFANNAIMNRFLA